MTTFFSLTPGVDRRLLPPAENSPTPAFKTGGGPVSIRSKDSTKVQSAREQPFQRQRNTSTSIGELPSSNAQISGYYPIVPGELAKLRKGSLIVIRFTTTPLCSSETPTSGSHYYNSLPKALLERLCPKLTARTIELGPDREYVVLEDTSREAVTWMMNWIWAGGRIIHKENSDAGLAKVGKTDASMGESRSDAVMQSLTHLHLVLQLGIKGPIRNELFTGLRGGIASAGALRAEHMAFVQSHFGDNSVSSPSQKLPDGTLAETKPPHSTTDGETAILPPLSPSEQEFYPRFAHDLVILVMTRNVQVPLATNSLAPLSACISRALHNKSLLSQIEAQQATHPLTYSQLDFLANHTTPASHTLLRRTVCGGLVRLLETERAGMTYWSWASKRSWDAEMRRARKERGAWLVAQRNEEARCRLGGGGQTDGGLGEWQRAFATHRDFWKPVYEAERDARGGYTKPAETSRAEEGQRWVSAKTQGGGQTLPSAKKDANATPSMDVSAILQSVPSCPMPARRLIQPPQTQPLTSTAFKNLTTQAPIRQASDVPAASASDTVPTTTPVTRTKYVPGATLASPVGPRSKAAKKNAKKRAKRRERNAANQGDAARAGDGGGETSVGMSREEKALLGNAMEDAEGICGSRFAGLGVEGALEKSRREGAKWAEMGG